MNEEENRYNDRLKIWLDFLKFILGTFILGLAAVYINSDIQGRELDLKEQDQIARFLNQALEKDVGTRKRFSEYFANVTQSKELKKGWKDYYSIVLNEYKADEEKKKVLENEVKNLPQNDPKKELLQMEIYQLQKKLDPTPPRKKYKSDTVILKSDGHTVGVEQELCVSADSGGYLDPSSVHDNTVNLKGLSQVESILIDSSVTKVCKKFRLLKNKEGTDSEASVNFEIEGG